jgi:DNA helicase HerA-like ATPase
MFRFEEGDLLGTVNQVDTHRVQVLAESHEHLNRARVGALAAISVPGHRWLIGMVERVVKRPLPMSQQLAAGEEAPEDEVPEENSVQVITMGSLVARGAGRHALSRSVLATPATDAKCYMISGRWLQALMGVIGTTGAERARLDLGHYTLDPSAPAYLDGNRFFQRHAAILGSTGSGKSFAVARILERAQVLPASNVILFDLHGEYTGLSYARPLRIATPDDLASTDPAVLFLPYWLLSFDELQSLFVDRSEFSAHNQVMVFLEAVLQGKRATLEAGGHTEVLASFTVNSPVPYPLDAVIEHFQQLNTEMEQAARGGLRQGKFFGQFSRLLVRLQSKRNDKRYGFMLRAPAPWHEYTALERLAKALMDFDPKKPGSGIKVLDFSEVPSDVLPVVVGTVARLVFQLQMWLPPDSRQPIAMVCDEAHLYLPRNEGLNPVEERALEDFERIAKEGRKYGVGLVVVSQRPSDVSTTILSQCNNFIALRLTNRTDQETVHKLLPDHMRGLMETLPMLDVGEALIVGDAVLLPTRVKLSPPATENRPSSATVDFWDDWLLGEHRTDLARAAENLRRQSRG